MKLPFVSRKKYEMLEAWSEFWRAECSWQSDVMSEMEDELDAMVAKLSRFHTKRDSKGRFVK